jgi:chromosome segregation ATPase
MIFNKDNEILSAESQNIDQEIYKLGIDQKDAGFKINNKKRELTDLNSRYKTEADEKERRICSIQDDIKKLVEKCVNCENRNQFIESNCRDDENKFIARNNEDMNSLQRCKEEAINLKRVNRDTIDKISHLRHDLDQLKVKQDKSNSEFLRKRSNCSKDLENENLRIINHNKQTELFENDLKGISRNIYENESKFKELKGD